MNQFRLLKPEQAAKRATNKVRFFKLEQERNAIRSKLSEEARKGLDIALSEFVRSGAWDQVERLLRAGADIDFKDERNDWMTLLMEAAFEGKCEVVRKLVEEYGATVDLRRDKDGGDDTALMFCACNAENAKSPGFSARETVRILLRHGADVNAQDRDGITPLIGACGWETGSDRGNAEVVNMLILAGADVNAQATDGGTPLAFAVCAGWSEIVGILIEKKADVNLPDIIGETPLMIVSRIGNLEIAKMLLDAGAEINLKDEEGETALDHAIEQKNGQIAEFLRSKGGKKGSEIV